jgi:hypothetical protein
LTKNRSSLLKLSAATCLALLAAGSLSTALAQQRGVTKPQPKPAPSVRTSREASLIALNESKLACVVVPNKELFITDVSVVDDCFRTTWFPICPAPVLPATRGAWTFGGLMPGIFGTNNPAILSNEVTRWLKEWSFNKVVNGELVPARPAVQAQVIGPWLAASGGVQLDMKRAPFRLLAIVSRLDLRGNAPFTAGEGRFVFNLLNPAGNPTQYLLILEYGLDAKDCTGIMSWANVWHGLGTSAFGPVFNARLQKVTDLFTTIGASPGKPNGSAINQVRSDDFFLAAPWELRQFTLQPSTTGPPAPLLISTVTQTPQNAHQNSALLANFINSGTPTVPLSWLATPFRGGASTHALNFDWDGPPPPCTSTALPARHDFSLNTCNGCHGAETGTIFKHVEPRNPGVQSLLSDFLTGAGPVIVDMCGLPHAFSDIARRQTDLCNLLGSTCAEINAEPPVGFVH